MDHFIDITSLPDGLHKLSIRAQDEGGVWSQTNNWNFYKKQLSSSLQNIVAAEYYFNADPGFGLGTTIPVPGNSSQIDVSFIADLSFLDEGSNKMFVRTKDALGRWSQTTVHHFFKKTLLPALPDIVYAEYYVDSDPGIGQGISIPVPNPGPDVTDLTFQLDQSLLVMGNHLIFLRTKDENGRWSQTLLYEFCHTPKADFAANDVWFGETTTFTDLSYLTDENTEYYWDVDGDNVTDYIYNTGFTHTYASAGTYNARLILISPEGCPDTLIKQVSAFTCSVPTALSVNDTTETSAILFWSAANMETAWQIEFGPAGFTLGNGTLISNIYNIQYYLGGLASNTSYDFYVRSACYGSTVSDWAGPGTFTTLEGAPCSNPTDGGKIAAGQTICFAMVPAPFTNVSPATNFTGTLEYKWQSSTDNIDYVDIPGSNSEGFDYSSTLTTTTWFRRLARVTCQVDWSGAASSDTIEITIDARDRYRTKTSGDWDNPSTWETFDGTQWVDATVYPSSASIGCPNSVASVQNGHTVGLNTNIEFGNVVVDEGGILEIGDGAELGIVANDTLTIKGKLIMHAASVVNGAGTFELKPLSTIHVGSAKGITANTPEGNIKVTGERHYEQDANYVYIGTTNQQTGDGFMQNTPGNLTINAPGITVTLSQEINISGNIYIIQGTLDVNTFNISLGGNWVNNDVFIPGTATVYFNNTIDVTVSVSNFYNIVFAGSDTVTAAGNLTIYGEITINNYFNGGSFTHFVYGNWVSNGSFIYGTSTIQFMGSGNIYISISNFYNIVFAGTGTVTAQGSLSIYGNVSINNHFEAGSFVHYVYGNWLNNGGTFIHGTSTIHFLGSGNINIGSSNFYHVIFGGTGTITATGALTFYGNVIINNYFAAGSFVHYVYGNWTNNGAFIYNTSTIQFIGSGNIFISSSDFYHIIFAGTGTITATGSLSVYGDFTINNYFNAASYIHYIYGNWYNNGVFVYGTSTIHFIGTGNVFISANEFYHVIFDGSGTITATGSLTFYGDVTINNHFDAGSFIHCVYGSWTNTGTFVYGTSTIHFIGNANIYIGASDFYHVIFAGIGTITATGSLSVYGDFTINHYFDGGSYIHYIYGGWYNNGTFVHNTSTIWFMNTANIVIGINNFYHVVFAGIGTVTASGSLTIYGDITIHNNFDAGSFTHYVYGNWINNGLFIYGTSTILFNGTAQQTIDGSNETDFHGFSVNNSYGILLFRSIIVRNLLTLTEGVITTGSYTVTILSDGSITGGSAMTYIYGRLICGYDAVGLRVFPVGTANEFGPMVLNYTSLTGTSLVQVEFVEGTIPGTIPGNLSTVADHYWTISQTGGINYTFTLTLDVPGYSPLGTVRMLRGDGFTVNQYETTTTNYTNIAAFNTFGDFTLGEMHCSEPTGLINRYITYTTAIIDWSQGDSETEWNVEYGPKGFTPGTGIMLTNISSRPLEITGLTPESYYEFYVQSICSEEVQSSWAGPASFSTFPKQLDATIFFEGPYDESADLMMTSLSNSGVLPLTQPYQG